MAFFGGGGASVDLASPPAIGNTTANTGRFTTVESTSRQFITTVDGSIQIGKDGGNALGGNSITIQPRRFLTERVASGQNGIAIGESTRAGSTYAIAIGTSTQARTGSTACAVGYACDVTSTNGLALGGDTLQVSADNATNLNGAYASTANLRGMLLTRSFASLYWSGTTTNNTATVLNLDGTATNRFTIAANTAAMVDLNIIARRTDTVDKWFSSRRTVAIRRNNANGTAIIGSVQNVGTDQTEGSPTWSVAITADDTNEALQVEVTGATGETVNWRVMAFYQVV